MIRPARGFAAVLLALGVWAACDVALQEPDSGITTPPGPRFQVEAVSGDDQSATAGQTLAAPLTVRVIGRAGAPLEGVPVEWVVTAGMGRVTPDSVDTDRFGLARAVWTLGEKRGAQTVEARVWPNVRAEFSAEAR